MEATRFDSLLRSLSTTPSRRNALRFLAGSALSGLLGLEQLQTKAKKGGGKGKKKRCRNKGKTTICHNGQTIEVSNCSLKAHEKHGDTLGPCPPFCAGKPDLTDCGGGKKCSGGVCETEPICGGFNAPCDLDTECCTNFCAGNSFCGFSQAGEPCHVDADCGTNTCVGFVCQP